MSLTHQQFLDIFNTKYIAFGGRPDRILAVACNDTEQLLALSQSRRKIYEEEHKEMMAAWDAIDAKLANGDLPTHDEMTELFDGIIDTNYVNVGTAVAFNLSYDQGFTAVALNNNAKFRDGAYVNDYGKLVKPDDHQKVNLHPFTDYWKQDDDK